jgi:hypothetical protein
MITKRQYEEAAQLIGCDVAAIKAVEEVESKGDGFLTDGKPMILFEPHIFWKELRKRNITPVVSDICYPKWGSRPYGRYTEQHAKLEQAAAINREAALCSASWGKFQIMGFNWEACGCESLQEFINAVYKSEDEQLRMFCNYIMHVGLDDELREKDWAGFACSYNGPLYRKNNYDGKLAMAYQTHKR